MRIRSTICLRNTICAGREDVVKAKRQRAGALQDASRGRETLLTPPGFGVRLPSGVLVVASEKPVTNVFLFVFRRRMAERFR
jgi:hypothetical protein